RCGAGLEPTTAVRTPDVENTELARRGAGAADRRQPPERRAREGERIKQKLSREQDLDDRFFFPSRRRHTRLVSDWSSDVCSSDLTRRARNVLSSALSQASGARHFSFQISVARGKGRTNRSWRRRSRHGVRPCRIRPNK